MNFDVADLCMFVSDPDSETPPSRGALLERASVAGTIRLPKIVSQMIQTDPLESKFGYLWVKAKHLVINGSIENLIGLSDFR